ncbi:MAG TPA: hypothetical protein VGY98_14365 [Verrucomicrobiae bacterium]|nr:hypothetical protein [Verrucomicrobiae bacterium]
MRGEHYDTCGRPEPRRGKRQALPQLKQISNEFITRALHCDGYENAGFISNAASALLMHLSTPPCLERGEAENVHRKRLPVIHFPPFVIVPRISFIE